MTDFKDKKMEVVKTFKPKTFPIYQIRISYHNKESEIQDCTFYGAMDTMPGFIGFSNTPLEEVEELPFLVISAETISKIEVLGQKEKFKK